MPWGGVPVPHTTADYFWSFRTVKRKGFRHDHSSRLYICQNCKLKTGLAVLPLVLEMEKDKTA